MRKGMLILAGIAILALANYAIVQKEQQLANGRVVLLELAPVDPRSLMQGDYMALRFKIAEDAFGRWGRTELRDGRIVVGIDARGVAEFRRLDDGARLAPDEALLRYRVRERQVRFATNAFFFQEGHAKYYEPARYGEFRVSETGDLLLANLRGKDFDRLDPGAAQPQQRK